MSVFITRSGLEILPQTFTESQVRIGDIAWNLSTKHRYNGSAAWLYSVLQHEWLLSAYFNYDRRLARAALIHDSAEFLIGDQIRPIKHQPDMAPYREWDDRITKVIFNRLNVDYALMDEIKWADAAICVDEMKVLCHHVDPSLKDVAPLGVSITFQSQHSILNFYGARFRELFPEYMEF